MSDSFTREKIVDKVKKLLRLANCKTAPEAASAAALAQKLIDKFKLEAELLADAEAPDAPPAPPLRPVEETIYRFPKIKADAWVVQLVGHVARNNGCYTVWSSGFGDRPAKIDGFGQPDDLQTVAYLVTYLVGEVERLAKEGLRKPYPEGPAFPGQGRAWGNSFRLGAVREIGERLSEAKRRFRDEAREEARRGSAAAYERAVKAGDTEKLLELDRAGGISAAPQFALAKVETALARLEQRFDLSKEEAHKRWDGCLRSRRHRGASSDGGYEAGRKAGRTINLSRQSKRLT